MTESDPKKEHSSTLNVDELPNLIQKWLWYTKPFPTTTRFNLWSAIAAVGGAMQRRCWIVTSGRQLFPNTFIVLVSPPGVGKSDAIQTVRDVWRQFMNLSVAPQSMTGKGIIDQLAADQSIHTVKVDGEDYRFSSLLVPVSELGTLIQEYDITQISILNELYDCGPAYQERTRGGGFMEIERPHVSMVMGTQPKFMGHVFPETAFGMGLTSRMILVYDDETVSLDLFGDHSGGEDEFNALVKSFKPVAGMKGQFEVSQDARGYLQEQHQKGFPPRPETLKLAHYNTRRTAHILKLSMIMGAARHGEPYIEQKDVENAIDVLLDAELDMENIFQEMSGSSETDVIREAFQHIMRLYHGNEKKPVKEETLHAFLQQRVAAWKIEYIINAMYKSGAIKRVGGGGKNSTQINTIVPGKL